MRLAFGDFVIDFDQRRLLSAQQEVRLTPKAFDLLRLLIETRPKALSKQEIFDRLWPGTFVTENNLATLVADLRSSLGDQASEPRFIRTVYAFGYAFVGDIAAPSPVLAGGTSGADSSSPRAEREMRRGAEPTNSSAINLEPSADQPYG